MFLMKLNTTIVYHPFPVVFSSDFLLCSVVLFPVAVTFFITWWFIQFVDGFFSPIYEKLGVDIFGELLSHFQYIKITIAVYKLWHADCKLILSSYYESNSLSIFVHYDQVVITNTAY